MTHHLIKMSTNEICLDLVKHRNKEEQKSRNIIDHYSQLMMECQQLKIRCKSLEQDNRRLNAMVGAIGKLEIPEGTELDLE